LEIETGSSKFVYPVA